MGEKTLIEWTDSSWNPWTGCTKVSIGCKNCYMYRDKKRYGQNPSKVVRSKTTFKAPLNKTKFPSSTKVFTCSWSDFFHPDADEWIGEAWDVIAARPDLIFQILTKRPGRMGVRMPSNVWAGITGENQKCLDGRMFFFKVVEAPVKFLSLEPLLGPIRIPSGVDWIVCGAETGSGKRKMDIQWAKDICWQCKDRHIPFFFKKDSDGNHELDGKVYEEYPEAR